jgi:hypothetical protein
VTNNHLTELKISLSFGSRNTSKFPIIFSSQISLYILEYLPLELQEVAERLLEGVERVEEEIVLTESIVIIIQSRFPIELGQLLARVTRQGRILSLNIKLNHGSSISKSRFGYCCYKWHLWVSSDSCASNLERPFINLNIDQYQLPAGSLYSLLKSLRISEEDPQMDCPYSSS